jgi:Tol biopolymer transport system component
VGGGADDPDGEVILSSMADSGHDLGPRSAVTCDNDARETHPQLEPRSFQVVYASDRVTGTSPEGDWELYVASFDIGLERRARSARAPDFCNGWVNTQVTRNTGDDLWPAWVDGDTLVYSSTEEDPLGDIWTFTLGDAEPVRQTDSPAAETQPVPVNLGASWIVFTTTQFRPDGSLGYVSPTDGEPLTVESLWPGGSPPQGTEAAWAPENPGYLAYTSTDQDPYGDVWITNLVGDVDSGGSLGAGSRAFPVADEPGVAESHPAWRNVFDDDPSPEPPPTPDEPVLGRVSPFGQGPRLTRLALDAPPDGVAQDEYAELLFTRRSIDADITDVVAADGSDRTVRVRGRFSDGDNTYDLDEAGPAYSPDGEQLAFSRQRGSGHARDLMIADADGSGVRSLSGLTGNQGDVDMDPVFSPEGTRIAFTRYSSRGDPEESVYGAPTVWVVDLEGGPDNAFRVTPPPPALGTAVIDIHDTGPTWSPHGDFLVTSMASAVRGNEQGGASRAAPVHSPDNRRLVVVEAREGGRAAALFDDIEDGRRRPIPGRSPAWSPDGSQIVYEDRGSLRLVPVTAAGPSDAELANGYWQVGGTEALTAFEDDEGHTPTASRDRISVAEDPAWSEDGTEIVFAGQPPGLPDQRGIYGIAPDGSGLRPLTDEPGPETEPAWQPRPEADLAVTVTTSGSPADVGEPVLATYAVTNLGPSPAYDVTLETTVPPGADSEASSPPPGCAADGSGCTRATMASGESLSYEVSLSWPAPVSGDVVGKVDSTTHDPDLGNNTDRAPVFVDDEPDADLAVRVRIVPVGYVGGERTARVVVVNRGPRPAEDVDLRVRLPRAGEPVSGDPCLVGGGTCALGTLSPGAAPERLAVTLRMTNPDRVDVSRGILRARVSSTTPDPEPADNRDRAPIRVLQPAIRLLPEVARPGMVVLAYGERMPPRSRVRLRWTRGITVSPGPYRVAGDGTLQHPILIVRRDRLAEREIRATSVGGKFGTVEGPLLVVMRLLMAPDFRGRG